MFTPFDTLHPPCNQLAQNDIHGNTHQTFGWTNIATELSCKRPQNLEITHKNVTLCNGKALSVCSFIREENYLYALHLPFHLPPNHRFIYRQTTYNVRQSDCTLQSCFKQSDCTLQSCFKQSDCTLQSCFKQSDCTLQSCFKQSDCTLQSCFKQSDCTLQSCFKQSDCFRTCPAVRQSVQGLHRRDNKFHLSLLLG